MAYATVDDMVLRFGAAEMARATTPENMPVSAVNAAPIETALDDASAQIDSYLRKRYAVPLQAVPPEINRACCMLARADLGMGGERNISEQTQKAKDEAVAWLARIARGEVVLGMEEVSPGEESFATGRHRHAVYGAQNDTDDFGEGFGFWEGGI